MSSPADSTNPDKFDHGVLITFALGCTLCLWTLLFPSSESHTQESEPDSPLIAAADHLEPGALNAVHTAASALDEGRQLFTILNCGGCHGEMGVGGVAPSLRDDTWQHGGTDEQIFTSIAHGRSFGMPAWGTLIPEADIWKLVAYIRTLRPSESSQVLSS